MDIDVVLISGRRPTLLQQTLDSFSDRVLRHFRVRNVHANVDPYGGTDADGDDCARIIRDALPKAQIRRPAQPNLCRAVQSCWLQTGDLPVLHLEDDWLCLIDITPEMIGPLLTPGVGSIHFHHGHRTAPEREFLTQRKKYHLWLFKVYRAYPAFGTSPRILGPGFAHNCAARMNPRLDPEKQVYQRRNRRLTRYTDQFRTRGLYAPGGTPVMVDIGRDWQRENNVKKVVRRGVSHWVPRDPE
ncbi:hypothetical protein [Frigidibacter mobilis]|uniref:Glycosyl transferase family 2 n=1 Tax=Frigidibacter mobilis TaxID=1335048 RepID=A0A159Z389_9RHOB|nr:hypothetical protein [Frigidibacter mobilis]AMY69552.1 hypothetical protein AKL17_2306 [Frigidibacter mobilis]